MQRPDVRDDLGDVLRQHRLDAGLSQEALAERAQVGLRSIQGIERGERRPHRGTLQRLVRALGLSSEQTRRLEELTRAPVRPPRATVLHLTRLSPRTRETERVA